MEEDKKKDEGCETWNQRKTGIRESMRREMNAGEKKDEEKRKK